MSSGRDSSLELELLERLRVTSVSMPLVFERRLREREENEEREGRVAEEERADSERDTPLRELSFILMLRAERGLREALSQARMFVWRARVEWDSIFCVE